MKEEVKSMLLTLHERIVLREKEGNGFLKTMLISMNSIFGVSGRIKEGRLLHNEASRYYENKNFQTSYDFYSRSIQKYPNAGSYYSRGVVAMELNDYERAIADFSSALQFDKDYINAYFNRALCFWEMLDSNSLINDPHCKILIEFIIRDLDSAIQRGHETASDLLNIVKRSSELEKLVYVAVSSYQNGEGVNARLALKKLLIESISNTNNLMNERNYELFGKAFCYILVEDIAIDSISKEFVTKMGYLFLSKAINNDENNANLVKDRLTLLWIGKDYFTDTVAHALDLIGDYAFAAISPSAGFEELDTEKAIIEMMLADLENTPILCERIEAFRDMKTELLERINNGSRIQSNSISSLVVNGERNHKKVLGYIERSDN